MQVELNVDGQAVAVDLDFNRLTLQDTVAVRRLLGDDYQSTLGAGNVSDPLVIHALLFVKLRGMFPDLEPDGFDVDMSALFAVSEEIDANPTTGN